MVIVMQREFDGKKFTEQYFPNENNWIQAILQFDTMFQMYRSVDELAE